MEPATAFGRFGGGFRNETLSSLSAHAVRETFGRSRVPGVSVDHLVFGNVLPATSDAVFASRVITLEVGMPLETSSFNVSRACGTGTQAIVSAAEQIMLGHSDIAIACGAEVTSAAPHVLNVRWGAIRGPEAAVDMIDWAYRDPFGGQLMGETAEALTEKTGIGRARQDEYAYRSQQRTEIARKNGYLAEEIVGVDAVTEDEFPRPETTMEALEGLRTPFREGGCVTAGNSSGLNDGAAAIAVLSASAAERHGVEPDGRLLDWAVVGVEPDLMGRGPVPATQLVMERTGLSVSDMDVAEVNEAFAVVVLNAIDQLRLDPDIVNPNGGAISIGHPPGATGLRMTMAALNELRRRGGRYGLVTMCLGAGQGMAIVVENLR